MSLSQFTQCQTYLAAKSKQANAPWLWRRRASALVSLRIPVTLLQAENDPNIGLLAYFGDSSSALSASMSISPSPSTPISTTSARLCRHDRMLEWCSYGPTNTTHLSSSLRLSRILSLIIEETAIPIVSCSLLIHAVVPDPQKSSASPLPARMQRLMYSVASRTIFVVLPPTKLSLVCVLPEQQTQVHQIFFMELEPQYTVLSIRRLYHRRGGLVR